MNVQIQGRMVWVDDNDVQTLALVENTTMMTVLNETLKTLIEQMNKGSAGLDIEQLMKTIEGRAVEFATRMGK